MRPPTPVTRRNVVRGAAWGAPAAVLVTPVPAFAVSPACAPRSTAVNTTQSDAANPAPGYTRTDNQNALWTTTSATGFGNVSIAVTATKTTADILYGFNASTNNLIPYSTGGVTGISVNQRPSSATVPRDFANRTITTFAFNRPVFGLSFRIADISKSSVDAQGVPQTVQFWDAVWVESGAAFTIVRPPTSEVVGSGATSADPLTPRVGSTNAEDSANWTVTLTFNCAVNSFKIHYWSALKTSNANDSGGGQGITVENMTMKLAPTGCTYPDGGC